MDLLTLAALKKNINNSNNSSGGGDVEQVLVPITAVKDDDENIWFVSNLKDNDDVFAIFEKPCSAKLVYDNEGVMSNALVHFYFSVEVSPDGVTWVDDRVIPCIVPLIFYYDSTDEVIVPVLQFRSNDGTVPFPVCLPLYQNYQVGNDTYKACNVTAYLD